MAKRKSKPVNVTDLFGEGVTYVYLVIMLGVFPVYYPGTLIGINSVKSNFFITAALVYAILMIFPFVCRGIAYRKEHRKIKFDAGDLFGGVFLIALLFSTIVSLDRTRALFGNNSIKTGAVILFFCIVSYYGIKKYAKYDAILIWVSLLAGAFIYLSGIFLTCQIDPLDMQKDIVDIQKGIFVSPLGNVNYNVAYIGLMLSAAMVMFLLCKETFTKRVLAIYLYIGLVDSICIRVESALAMLVVVFALLLYFALEKEEWFVRYISVIQIFIASNVTVYLLKLLLKDHMYVFSGSHTYLLKPQIIVMELILCFILFWLKKRKFDKEEDLLRLQKLYGIFLLVIFVAFVIFMLALNLFFRNTVSGTVLGHLVLADNTGNGRGYVWIRTVEAFQKIPFINKMFGCGAGCFYDFIYPWYGAEMMELFNAVFYDPHNDFLQVLVMTGIVGVVGFFGLIFSVVVSAWKKRKNREMQIAAIMALAAFLVQGLVNSFTIFSLPFLFVLLGLAQAPGRDEQKE